MIADLAAEDDPLPGAHVADRQFVPFERTDPGGIDEDAVGIALAHHFGIARDDPDLRRARGIAHRGDDRQQIGHRQAVLDDQAERQVERAGAADRKVVHRAAHRDLADVAVAEDRRHHHERIAGDGDAAGGEIEPGAVFHRADVGIAQNAGDALDQFPAVFTAAAMIQNHGFSCRRRVARPGSDGVHAGTASPRAGRSSLWPSRARISVELATIAQ